MSEQTQHTPTYRERETFGETKHRWTCSCGRGYASEKRTREAAEEDFAKHVLEEHEREEREANPVGLDQPVYIEIDTSAGNIFGLAFGGAPIVQLVLHPDGNVTWQRISFSGAAPIVPKHKE